MMHAVNRRKEETLLALFRVALYALIPAAFFLVLSITNPQMLRISRTSAITVSSFLLMEYLFTRIYGGYQPGIIQARSNLASMGLTTVFSDLIVYLQLQIMNVNEANNESLVLFGIDALLLLAIMGVQLAIIALFAAVGDKVYFSAHPPLRTCVITGNEEDREIVCNKLSSHARHLNIDDCFLYTSEDVRGHVKRSEAVVDI